jgi:alcohol dehydrogenase
LILRPGFPAIPCFDVCGVIEALGPGATDPASGVKGFALGERIVCRPPGLRGGAAADRIVVPAAVSARAPEALRVEEAAGLPLAGQTALQALRMSGGLEAGRRVLVIGAAGGVGHLAVQIARAHGARPTGVCSSDNLEFVASLGAEHVIDYRAQPDLGSWGTFETVVDCVGAASAGSLALVTAPTGRVSLVAPTPAQLWALVAWPLVSRRRARLTLLQPSGADLRLLCDLADRGALAVTLDGVFEGLDSLPAAFERSMTGRVRGKVIVRL